MSNKKQFYSQKKNKDSSKQQQQNHADNAPFVREKKEVNIIAYCKICSTGISNSTYALSNEEDFVHFECALKKAREVMTQTLSYSKKYKVSYLGSLTFGIYTEKGGNFQWEIQKKITLKELLGQ
jgi:hypothetical protein